MLLILCWKLEQYTEIQLNSLPSNIRFHKKGINHEKLWEFVIRSKNLKSNWCGHYNLIILDNTICEGAIYFLSSTPSHKVPSRKATCTVQQKWLCTIHNTKHIFLFGNLLGFQPESGSSTVSSQQLSRGFKAIIWNICWNPLWSVLNALESNVA